VPQIACEKRGVTIKGSKRWCPRSLQPSLLQGLAIKTLKDHVQDGVFPYFGKANDTLWKKNNITIFNG